MGRRFKEALLTMRLFRAYGFQRHQLLFMGLALSLAMLTLSACGAVVGQNGPPSLATETPYPVATSRVTFQNPAAYSVDHPFYAARITFAHDVSFGQALRQVTDLGLQPLYWCDVIHATYTWHPLGEQAGFTQNNELDVEATPDAPSDWLAHLNTASNIIAIYDGLSGCTSGSTTGSPPPDPFIGNGDYQTYAGVDVLTTFRAGESYDLSLSAVSNLGFRLADPCFEQALRSGAKPPWRSPGQAQTFAATHTLIVATTTANSTQWQQQLRSTSGVTMIEQPYQPTCAA